MAAGTTLAPTASLAPIYASILLLVAISLAAFALAAWPVRRAPAPEREPPPRAEAPADRPVGSGHVAPMQRFMRKNRGRWA